MAESLYDRLVAELVRERLPSDVCSCMFCAERTALLAVVRLHAPEQRYGGLYCDHCGTTSPCAEPRIIAAALGVELDPETP